MVVVRLDVNMHQPYPRRDGCAFVGDHTREILINYPCLAVGLLERGSELKDDIFCVRGDFKNLFDVAGLDFFFFCMINRCEEFPLVSLGGGISIEMRRAVEVLPGLVGVHSFPENVGEVGIESIVE